MNARYTKHFQLNSKEDSLLLERAMLLEFLACLELTCMCSVLLLRLVAVEGVKIFLYSDDEEVTCENQSDDMGVLPGATALEMGNEI